MNKKEKSHLEKVYMDCLKLEKQRKLTEYGAGQADMCIKLLGKKRRAFVHIATANDSMPG